MPTERYEGKKIMPGRKKIFDFQSRRERYASSGINEKLIFNLRDIHCTMRQLYEGKGSVNRVLIVLSKARVPLCLVLDQANWASYSSR